MTDDLVARLRQQARNRYLHLADGELAARQTVEWKAADWFEARVRELEAMVSALNGDVHELGARLSTIEAEAYERAASKCEELQKAFATDEYALNQPHSSFGERYACGRCAEEIRSLAQEVKHEAE